MIDRGSSNPTDTLRRPERYSYELKLTLKLMRQLGDIPVMIKRKSRLPESVAISSVRLTREALDRMLADLNAEHVIPTVDYRKEARVSCPCTLVVVVVNQDGYESTFLIPLRDLSRGGIAFLHRSMLHKGTQCTIRMRTPDQRWLQVYGRVVRSRYIRDMVYEIGLKFREPVDLAKYGLLGEPVA